MTWFFKAVSFWGTLILLGYTLEVLGYTLYMCKQDCMDQPDAPVCSRWNFTTDERPPRNVSVYKWLRNECERKCFQYGTYERADPMELCYQNGQNQTTYFCSKYKHSKSIQRCMRNESLPDD